MLISLDWIRDFVDLPRDLDPHELAERFTCTTAEVEEVLRVDIGARGLIAAGILSAEEMPAARNLRLVTLDVGGGKTVETVTAAPVIHEGVNVVYAPPGSSIKALGEIGSADVAGKTSAGMILPGDAIGIALAAHEAIFINNTVAPGEELPPEAFDDYVIEVDNKSLTHRPDLWGHYGIARELAAIYKLPLAPYPIVELDELADPDLPDVPISIQDSGACRRYSGIVLTGVPTQPAPLWMQLRLGRAGMRPISALVDLTNYIMTDLGQPMHAFDAAKMTRIEVAWARDGEVFRTLDGVERELTAQTLMIQCEGKSVALAGVMGGLETEVSEATTGLLLESANFEAATIRRTAGRLGLRTDASARFEKSLDPSNTALAIQRFIKLARPMFPEMKLASRLSDDYPTPLKPAKMRLDPQHVARTVGRTVPQGEIADILSPLGFEVTGDGNMLSVTVPTFRATNDVTIEEDVIEEIARYIGYGTIPPAMPHVALRRFEPNKLHDLERASLEHFTEGERFVEIHGYLWYDSTWIAQLGMDPGSCVELVNPAADGLHRLRRTLLPGILAAVAKNRFYFPAFSLIELGSVFAPASGGDEEFRHLGLVKARRGKKAEAEIYGDLKGAIERWAWRAFARPVDFFEVQPAADRPWECDQRTAGIAIAGHNVGRIGVVSLGLRRAMDEHLGAWAVTWAEIRLDPLIEIDHLTEPLGAIPPHPLVEMDFAFLVARSMRYADVSARLASFDHKLLKRISYISSYEGESVEADHRSLAFRTIIGDDSRTLTDEGVSAFRGEFERYLESCGYRIRK